jgi:hypothetical protein
MMLLTNHPAPRIRLSSFHCFLILIMVVKGTTTELTENVKKKQKKEEEELSKLMQGTSIDYESDD